MPVVDVMNLKGEKAGQVDLAEAVFGAKVNPHLLHETVRWYLNAQRAGTHKTKGRADVQGSGRKLWRQKGTGRARIGSIRSPLWRKGGTVHGPQPHTYDLAIPRKVKKLAMRVALSQKLRAERVLVLDKIEIAEPKTKRVAEMVRGLGIAKSVLFVEESANANLRRAARNHPQVKVVSPE